MPEPVHKSSPHHGASLLFIHGAGHSARCRDERFLDYFVAQGYHTITLPSDLRIGETYSPATGFVDDYVRRIRHVVDGLTAHPVLVGHGTGGFIVQEYLRQYRAPAAVLLCSSPSRAHLRSMMHASGLRSMLFADCTPESLVERCHAERDDTRLRALCPDEAAVAGYRPTPAAHRTPILVLDTDRDPWRSAIAMALTDEHGGTCELLPCADSEMLHDAAGRRVAERMHRWFSTLRRRTVPARCGSRPRIKTATTAPLRIQRFTHPAELRCGGWR